MCVVWRPNHHVFVAVWASPTPALQSPWEMSHDAPERQQPCHLHGKRDVMAELMKPYGAIVWCDVDWYGRSSYQIYDVSLYKIYFVRVHFHQPLDASKRLQKNHNFSYESDQIPEPSREWRSLTGWPLARFPSFESPTARFRLVPFPWKPIDCPCWLKTKQSTV